MIEIAAVNDSFMRCSIGATICPTWVGLLARNAEYGLQTDYGNRRTTRHIGGVTLIALIFVLGVGNFALHKAVIESRHPIVQAIPLYGDKAGGWIALGIEFAVLLAAMLLVSAGSPGWTWLYVAYSLANGLAAWMILTGRI